MTDDEKREVAERRGYTVSKGNDLVQKKRYEMSVQEQKTLAYIVSMIKPVTAADRVDGYQLDYEFDIRDYCRVCGIYYDSGKNYADVKSTLKKLADRSMWLDTGDADVICRWLSKVRIVKKSGTVKVRIDEDLAPYLFDLQKRFTEYQLVEILGMKSAYSIRLFEIFRSYQYQGEKTFELDELKHVLMVDAVKAYDRFPDFRRRVLEPAVKEINELTYTHVEYETITKGRKVTHIRFTIAQKTDFHERINAMKAQDAAIAG